MNIQAIIGKKLDQTQGFLEDGRRVPITLVSVGGNVISQIKTSEKEGYNAIQLGFGNNTKADKPTAGHIKKAGLTQNPRFFREIRVDESPDAQVAENVNVLEVFEAGDLVDVTGTSKGKGFAGVVKKWHFKGGPKTHGQSDRHRARGSSGSGTTPGRVFKGKKMAGRMGDAQTTVKNLEILEVGEDQILVRGLIPGSKGSIVVISKVGKNKKFMPLWSEKEEVVEEAPIEAEAAVEEVKTAEEIVETPVETVETASDTVETPDTTVATREEVVATPEEEAEASPEPEVSEKSEEVKEPASVEDSGEVKEENA